MGKQTSFEKINWQHRYSHGGSLRQKRAGRGVRPLSSKEPVHLVLKANKETIRGGFRLPRRFALIYHLLQKYRTKFFIKVEQVSIQGDHIHLLVRTGRRSLYHHFFRVLAGQISQVFEKEGLLDLAVTDTPKSLKDSQGLKSSRDVIETKCAAKTTGRGKLKLWKYRPFTRVIRGWRAYKTLRDYIQLNEKEALGIIPYRSERLRGLSSGEWQVLLD